MKQIKLSMVCVLLIFGLLAGNVAAQGGYDHSSGAFSLEEFLPLEEEIESGALFGDEQSMAVIFFGLAPIDITEELAPWIARPLLDSIPDFEDYELAETVDELNDGLLIHFMATPTAEAGPAELAGDVFMTRAGDVLYLALLISEDYEAVADDWPPWTG